MISMKELRLKDPNYRILYHMNFWDGVLSGVCLWDGERHYFSMIQEDHECEIMSDEDWKDWCDYCITNNIEIDNEDRNVYSTERIFAVYDTPDSVMEIIEENHNLFREYVGTHTDYDENGKRGHGARIPLHPDHPEDIGDLKPYSEHDKFYKSDRKQAKIDLENWKIIGNFIYPF